MNTNYFRSFQNRRLLGQLQFFAWLAAWMLQYSVTSFAEGPTVHQIASGNAAAPLPRMTPQEQQQFMQLKNKLATPLNSKDNPGDRYTWFVLGFMDAALAETRSQDASPLGITNGFLWSDNRSRQRRVVKDVIIVQGRTAAALAVLQYLYSPNAAAARLPHPPAARDGWYKRQATQVAVNRIWVYQAFAKEDDARQFLHNVRAGK